MTLSRRTGLLAGLLTVGLLATPALAVGPAPAAGPERPSGAYDGSRLLVAFDTGTPADERRSVHAAQGARVENTMHDLDLDVVRLPDGADAVEVAARYERIPAVAYTDFNHVFRTSANDTLYKDEWGLNNTGQSVTGSFGKGVADVDIDAPEGWEKAFGAGSFPASGGTLTGIIDTGIERAHADLLNKTKVCATATTATGLIVEGTCTDDNLHGTHVAGTIGAITNNGVGVAGVAPDAEFAVFKALNSAGTGFYADIVAGVNYLSKNSSVRIISMSIGGPEDDALNRALTEAYNRGTLLIAAAGNDGDATANWPAYHPDVMSVSSIDANGNTSSFSTCNSDVEIAAPGRDVWSTFPGNTYGSISGTSMATPHVSGVAAMLIKQQRLSAAQTRSALKSTAQGSGGCNGVGVVNLGSAMGSSSGGGTTEPAPVGTGTIAGTVTTGTGKNRTALSGATVDCGSGYAGTTGTDGAYTISSVPVGTYSCTASASGYGSKSASVTVNQDTTTTQDYHLR